MGRCLAAGPAAPHCPQSAHRSCPRCTTGMKDVVTGRQASASSSELPTCIQWTCAAAGHIAMTSSNMSTNANLLEAHLSSLNWETPSKMPSTSHGMRGTPWNCHRMLMRLLSGCQIRLTSNRHRVKNSRPKIRTACIMSTEQVSNMMHEQMAYDHEVGRLLGRQSARRRCLHCRLHGCRIHHNSAT